MYTTIPGSEGTVPVDAATRTELRATVTTVAAPVTGSPCLRHSAEVLELVRESGRVTGSIRLPADLNAPPVSALLGQAGAVVRAAIDGLTAGHAGPPGGGPTRGDVLRPESVLVTAGTRLRVLARFESPAGPLLAGGCGPGALPDLLRSVSELRTALTWPHGPVPRQGGPPPGRPCPGRAPDGWTGRPLVLRPAVAAVLLAGVRLVLGSTAAERLSGRRVLPDLSLLDRPVEHAEGEPDDTGQPASAHRLVSSGRVVRFPDRPDHGPAPGRSVWCHDTARPIGSATFGLTLTGRPVESDPDGAVELVACVEGLRRYHPDGRLWMLCLAMTSDSPFPFLVSVRARPLSLLRGVIGVTGVAVDTFLEHEINTPSLVLSSADELARKSHVLICSP